MRIVFFINKSNGFPAGMISYMEEHFPDQEMEFYTVDRRCEERLPDLPNVHRIHSYCQFLFDSDLIRHVRQADKIIVSGVFTLQYVLPIYGSSVLRKTWWQFWGGDYEDLQRDGRKIQWRDRINERILAHNLELAGGIILLTRPERSIFLKIFPFAEQKMMYYVPVPSSKEADELVQRIMIESDMLSSEGGEHDKTEDAPKTRVVLGNSATDSNCHLAMFEMLKHLKTEGLELCCPLSYGNAAYRQQVVERGTELFGESFHPITEYMSFEEYIRFLCSCSVGIYYNNRQQALGNINRILSMGKKVFLPEILRAYYEEYGFITFRSEDLAEYSMEELLYFSEQDRQHNLECVIRQKEAMERTWAEIIEG